MTLTYIWHDCFVFSDEKASIVFDFWKDPTVKEDELPDFITSLDKSKPLYIVVSHHHKDHYTKRIFEWSKIFTNIRYVLSKDVVKYCRHILNPDSIYSGQKPSPESIIRLAHGESYEDDIVKIDAFGSTDIGNSYAITIDGKTLFHAGDLNAWIWMDESTEEEVEQAIIDYNNILETIYSSYRYFDIAMFPVDSRIGSGYYTGAKIFVRKFEVAHFFPMHFGLGETDAEQMRYQRDAAVISNYANEERGEYICLQSPYSSFSEP